MNNLILDYPIGRAVPENKEINPEWVKVWSEYFERPAIDREYLIRHLENTWKFSLLFNSPLPTPPLFDNQKDLHTLGWANA